MYLGDGPGGYAFGPYRTEWGGGGGWSGWGPGGEIPYEGFNGLGATSSLLTGRNLAVAAAVGLVALYLLKKKR